MNHDDLSHGAPDAPTQAERTEDMLSMSMFSTRADYDAAVLAQAEQLHDWPQQTGINSPFNACMYRDDCRSEHAQRLTLQHHAADQVWRIADLEVKCVTLKELHDAAADERDALRAKYDELLVALHGIGAALGIPEGDRSPYSVTCGVLERVNRLAEIEAQEPVAKIHTDGYWTARRGHDPLSDGKAFLSVYANPAPAQAVPDASRAEAAGHEHAIGHLGALVEAQRLLLVDVEDICGRDGHGGQFEDGESEIIDRVRAHLATMAAPEAAR